MKMFGQGYDKQNLGECETKTTWCRNSLKFKIEKYVSSLSKKAAKKLSVLARLSHFTNDEY